MQMMLKCSLPFSSLATNITLPSGRSDFRTRARPVLGTGHAADTTGTTPLLASGGLPDCRRGQPGKGSFRKVPVSLGSEGECKAATVQSTRKLGAVATLGRRGGILDEAREGSPSGQLDPALLLRIVSR